MRIKKTITLGLFTCSLLFPSACRQTAPDAQMEMQRLEGRILTAEGKAPKMAHVIFNSIEGEDPIWSPADADGHFSVEIPKNSPRVVRFAAADHEEASIPVILDSDARVDVRLMLNPFRETFENPKITGSWCNFSFSKAEKMAQQEDGSFLWEKDVEEEKLSYQLLNITTNGHSVNGTQADSFEYDGGGDYRSLIRIEENHAHVVFDPALLPPSPEGEKLPKLLWDEAHRDLQQMAGLFREATMWGREVENRMSAFVQAGGNPGDFKLESSGLKNNILMVIGHGESEVLRRYAAVLLAGQAARFPGFDLSADEKSIIFQTTPSNDALWVFSPEGLILSADEEGFLLDAAENNPDRMVQKSALTALVRIAADAGNIEDERAYYARLKEGFTDLPGMKWTLLELDPDKKIKMGNPVPSFSLSLLNGKKITEKDLMGRWTLIDFWATWCSPCVGEMPNLDAAFKKYHERDFDILSLSLDQSEEEIEKFREGEWKMPWNHAFLEKGFESVMAGDFEVRGIPKPILVSPDGIIVGLSSETRGDNLLETLDRLLGVSEK